MNNTKVNKYYLIFGAVVANSAIFLLNAYIFKTTPGLTAPTLIFWGLLGANIVATVFFLRNKQSRLKVKREIKIYWKLVGAVSILTSVGVVLWFFAVSQLGSGITSLLEKSNVLFMFLLGIFFLKEKLLIKELWYALIALTGVFFIVNIKGEITSLGVSAILIGEAFYAVHVLLIKKFGKNISSLYFVYIRSLMILVIIGIFFGLLGKIGAINFKILVLGGMSLFIGTFVSKYFHFEALKVFPISKIGIYLLLESVVTVFGAYLFFGDAITIQKVIGGALILLGAGLLIREQEDAKKRNS